MNIRGILLLSLLFIVPISLFILIFNFGQGVAKPNLQLPKQKPKLYTIDKSKNTQIDVQATTLPKFAYNASGAQFNNLWSTNEANRSRYIHASIANARGNTTLSVMTSFDNEDKDIIFTPIAKSSLNPGLYSLTASVQTYTGENITVTQDFTWGVLAINTNKGIYQPGEQVNIGMAVLGNAGETKCVANGAVVFGTAKIWLTVTSPSGQIQKLSTDDNTIQGSATCADRSVTNTPDFNAQITPDETGTYSIHMTAQTFFGYRSMNYSFTVQNNAPPFDIVRTSYPTRIYPRADYPIAVTVTANEAYSGPVYDIVPASFEIYSVSDNGTVQTDGNYKLITWQVNWQKGDVTALFYTIHFPQVSPQFYLIGPMTIGSFTEGREWEIASDNLFSLFQEDDNEGAGVSSVTVTLSESTQSDDLLIVTCASNTGTNSFATAGPTSTPAVTFTRIGDEGSEPRLYVYYAVTTTSITTVKCSTSRSTENIGVQFLEFEGNSHTSPLGTDAVSRNNDCTKGSDDDQIITSSLTTPDNEELAVAAYVAESTNLTVIQHNTLGGSSSGFTDTDAATGDGFGGADGTYDSSWGDAINTSTVNDYAQLSAAGTSECSFLIATFVPPITVDQGSYTFYQNADNVNPLAYIPGVTNENVNLTGLNALSAPHETFRLRLLLDINSSGTNELATNSGDWVLQYAALSPGQNCAGLSTSSWTPVATTSAIAYNVNPGLQNFQPIATLSGTLADPEDGGYKLVQEDYMQLFSNPNTDGSIGDNDMTNRVQLGNNQAGEWDFSLIDDSDDSVSTVYCLGVFQGEDGDNDGPGTFAPIDEYADYPEVQTIDIGVDIRGGTTIRGSAGGTKIE